MSDEEKVVEENIEVIEKEEAISIEEDCEGFGEEK